MKSSMEMLDGLLNLMTVEDVDSHEIPYGMERGTRTGSNAENDTAKENFETGRNGSVEKYERFGQKRNIPDTVVDVEGRRRRNNTEWEQ